MRHSFLRWAKNVIVSSASLSGTGVALCVPPCEIQNVDNQLKKRKKCARTVKCISEIEYRRVVYSVATHFTVFECGHSYKQQLEEQKFEEYSHRRDGLRPVFTFLILSNQRWLHIQCAIFGAIISAQAY